MSDNAERLIVLLEARIRDFEKNMQKAAGTADGSYQRMRRGSRTATDQMADDMLRSTNRINQALASTSLKAGAYGRAFFAGVGSGAVAALAPVLSLTAALATAKKAVDDFSKTGDVAARLGVHVERLQELRFAAEQSGMAVDNFDVAFRRFIRRSSEAALGGGAAVGAFRELGIELRDNEGRLKESDKLLGEVADALMQVKTPADRLRLAFKLFDTDGAAMVNVLANGSRGLDEFARKAQELGLIVDRHLIERAEALGDELDVATRIIDTKFKQALISLAPVIVMVADVAARLADDIRKVVDAFRALEDKTTTALDDRMQSLGMERLKVEREILEVQEQQREGASITDAATGRESRYNEVLAERRAELDRIAGEEKRILEILESRQRATTRLEDSGSTVDASAEYLKNYRQELTLTQQQRRLATETERIFNDAVSKGADITRTQAEELAKLTIARDDAERAASRGVKKLKEESQQAIDAKEAHELYRQSLELERDLLFEREQMFRDPVEQRVYAELYRLGIDINSVRGQQLKTEIEITERLYEQKEGFEDLAGIAADMFSRPLAAGETFFDRMISQAGQFGQALQKAIGGKAGAGIGGALGGMSAGFGAQDPLMGAFGGALSGASTGMAAGPWGAAIGAIAGAFGGPVGGDLRQIRKRRK